MTHLLTVNHQVVQRIEGNKGSRRTPFVNVPEESIHGLVLQEMIV